MMAGMTKYDVQVGVGALAVGLGIVAMLYTRMTKPLLDRTRKKVKILKIEQLTADTKSFRVSTGGRFNPLGLPVGRHIRVFLPNPQKCLATKTWNGRPDEDGGLPEIDRSYTPTTGDEVRGYFDLVIKLHSPGAVRMPDGREMIFEDGGKMGGYLAHKKVGDFLEVSGPFGVVTYIGKGAFRVPGTKCKRTTHVGMIAGGSGITPILQVVRAALRDKADTTCFSLIYGNKTENDILVPNLLDEAAAKSGGRFTVHYTLDFPPPRWSQKQGFVTSAMIEECLPPLSVKPLMLLCGPPPMMTCCKNALMELGHASSEVVLF
eukprot:NODE_9154_length_1443_cov_8.926292.p1 GENE.NODE_9154_length_1443_cov_8.926292~~NODE_9154_length_1443_cov_8.926292.p1  ORF type:complete len:319 (-),score=87.19 NODE_9154_length_1443_cov_8.926292:397-1353(-)